MGFYQTCPSKAGNPLETANIRTCKATFSMV